MTFRTLLTIACCLLTACAAGPPQTPVPLINVPPPPNLLVPPLPLPAPASGRLRDLEANHLQVARQYHQLASQMCQLLLYLQVPPCPQAPTTLKTLPDEH